MLWGTPLPLVGNTTLFTWGESQSGSNSSGPAHSNKWYLGIGVMIGFVVIVRPESRFHAHSQRARVCVCLCLFVRLRVCLCGLPSPIPTPTITLLDQ